MHSLWTTNNKKGMNTWHNFTDNKAKEINVETYPEVDIECITVPESKAKKKQKVKKHKHNKGCDSSDLDQDKTEIITKGEANALIISEIKNSKIC